MFAGHQHLAKFVPMCYYSRTSCDLGKGLPDERRFIDESCGLELPFYWINCVLGVAL